MGIDLILAAVVATMVTRAYERSTRRAAAEWAQARQRAQARTQAHEKARADRTRARRTRVTAARRKGPRDPLWWPYAAGWIVVAGSRTVYAAAQGAREGASEGAREGAERGRERARARAHERARRRAERRQHPAPDPKADTGGGTPMEACTGCGVYVPETEFDEEGRCGSCRAEDDDLDRQNPDRGCPEHAAYEHDCAACWRRAAGKAVPADAARPCRCGRGTLRPVPDEYLHYDADGGAMVGLRCDAASCSIDSHHSWCWEDEPDDVAESWPATYLAEVRALEDSFEYEYCYLCGGDRDEHRIGPDPLGHAHLYCIREGRDSDPGWEAAAMRWTPDAAAAGCGCDGTCRNSDLDPDVAEARGLCWQCAGAGELVTDFGGGHRHVTCSRCAGSGDARCHNPRCVRGGDLGGDRACPDCMASLRVAGFGADRRIEAHLLDHYDQYDVEYSPACIRCRDRGTEAPGRPAGDSEHQSDGSEMSTDLVAAGGGYGTGEGYSDTVSTLQTLARQMQAAHETAQNLADNLTANEVDAQTITNVSELLDQLDAAAPMAASTAQHVEVRHGPVAEAVAGAGGSGNVATKVWYDDH